MGWIARRKRAWWEVVWSPTWVVIGTAYGVLQFISWLRGEVLPPDQAEGWRIMNLIPSMPAWAWVIGWLVLLLAIALEGAYRAMAKRDAMITTLKDSAGGRGLQEVWATIRWNYRDEPILAARKNIAGLFEHAQNQYRLVWSEPFADVNYRVDVESNQSCIAQIEREHTRPESVVISLYQYREPMDQEAPTVTITAKGPRGATG